MKKKLFNQLVASVRKGGAILRGELAPSRALVENESDIRRSDVPRRPKARGKTRRAS